MRSRAAIPRAPAMGTAVMTGAAPVDEAVAELAADEAADLPLSRTDEIAEPRESVAELRAEPAESVAEEL